LDAVSALVPSGRRLLLQGFDATAQAMQTLPLHQYSVIHVSAHAVVDDSTPELSGIALTLFRRNGQPLDGMLRPYQLAGLHLNGSAIVLSACNTALGKEYIGEGFVGLTASLFHAGAAQLVLTLAEVDAEASSAFLQAAYNYMFGPRRLSMEHALTLARKNLAGTPRWSDPFYWASFVLYGRPANLHPDPQ
jgi:CHAT domain-containing protein